MSEEDRNYLMAAMEEAFGKIEDPNQVPSFFQQSRTCIWKAKMFEIVQFQMILSTVSKPACVEFMPSSVHVSFE